jgi:hypothetical protein
MTVWSPPAGIRVKVLGLAWRGDALLLGEVEDSSGRVKGLRPLGGTVEFGEPREATLRREFQEELGCDVTIAGPWHAFENLYEHEGAVGHEYVFVADVVLGDTSYLERERFRYSEANGIACHAIWCPPAALPTGVALYPEGLLELLIGRDRAAPTSR